MIHLTSARCHRIFYIVGFASLVAVACGDEKVADTGPTGDTSMGTGASAGSDTSTGTGGAMDGETSAGTGPSCYSVDNSDDCGYVQPPRPGAFRPRVGHFTCDSPSLCATVTGTRLEGEGGNAWTLAEVSALECILTGLRDRVPATYRWRWYENGGQYDASYRAELLSNGTMIWSTSGFFDLGCGWSESLHTLPPEAFLDECLASQDPDRYWDCLFDLTKGTMCTGPAVCP